MGPYPYTLEVEPAEAGLTADGLPHIGGPATDYADRLVHLTTQLYMSAEQLFQNRFTGSATGPTSGSIVGTG